MGLYERWRTWRRRRLAERCLKLALEEMTRLAERRWALTVEERKALRLEFIAWATSRERALAFIDRPERMIHLFLSQRG
jgi:hypothetical protein